MILSVLISLTTGVAVALIVYYLYFGIVDYIQSQANKQLKDLLPEIESKDDRTNIRRLTVLTPILLLGVLFILFFYTRSTLSIIITILVAYFTFKGPQLLQRYLKSIQNKKIIEHLPDVINAVANSVKAGEALPIAFKVVGTKYPPPTSTIFKMIARRYESGQKFEDALVNVSSVLQIDAFDYLARAVSIHLRRGGPAYDMLSEIRSSIIEQDRCDRVIQATTAAGRFTINFLTFSPLFIIFFLSFLQPDWASILLGNILGIVITTIAVCIYLFALRWAKNILTIEKI